MNDDRVGWPDIFRGLAIILVVFAHVGRGLPATVWENFHTSAVDDWIYSFHIPAFFFAAGLFAGPSLRHRGRGHFVSNKLRTILYPYLLWSVIHIGLLWLIPGSAHSNYEPSMFLQIAYEPVGSYWFLYDLFIMQMLYALLVPTTWGRLVFYVICLLGWMLESADVFGSIIPHSPFWAWHDVLKYAIYFAFGDAVSTLSDANQPPRGSFGAALLFFGGLTFLIARGHNPEQSWWDLPLAVAGIQGLWELSVVLDRWGFNWLQYIGRHSLEIYVAHGLATAATRALLLKLGAHEMQVFMVVETIAGVAFPLILAWFCERTGFRWLFRL